MFSSRTDWDTRPNRLSDLVAAKKLRGESIFDLTESNPTRCGFSYPKQDFISSLANESALLYQPEPRGLLSTRTAIAEYYKTLGISVLPEHIVLTASTSEAYSFLLKLLCNVNDEVIVPRPSYPLFDYLCQLNDVTTNHYRLVYDGEWHIDFESFEAAFTDRTRAIILVHPNNPTGSFLKQNEFDRVCALASEHQCAIIADEVFQSYAFSQNARCANILASQHPVLLFSLSGISKLLGLPQLKISWIVVRGNPQKIAETLDRLDIISDTFLSVNTPAQVALPNLLRFYLDLGDQIQSRVQANYRLLQNIFAGSKVSVFYVEGGWYAILQLPQINSDDEWAEEFLVQLNILVQPGHFFDMEHKSCIVVSLLQPSKIFEIAFLQLQRYIREK